MNSSRNFPEELVMEILTWLPVKSLMRFKCVCRSWNEAISSDRGFISRHLERSITRDASFYVLRMDWWFAGERTCSLFRDDDFSLEFELAIPFVTPSNTYGVVSSSNGLVCVTDTNTDNHGRTLFLWNPFTRVYRTLDPSRTRSSFQHHHFHDHEATSIVLGFGYSSKCNDYKVVRILYFLDGDRNYSVEVQPQVEVYSLRTDSWKMIESADLGVLDDSSRACVNGNLHWMVNDMTEYASYRSIRSFDIADEVFGDILLPAGCYEEVEVDSVSLAVLKDSLALLVSCGMTGHRWDNWDDSCYVWIMTEYGVHDSWCKFYTIEPNGGIAGVHGFTRKGELLMDVSNGDHGELIVWNPNGSRFRNVRVSGAYGLINLVESLVSV